MQSQAVRSRNSKGSVSILVSNEHLQLRFHFNGKRHYLSLGLPDSKLNRKAAEAKAKLIESDIAFDRFDPTLAKYKPQSPPSAVTTITPKILFIDLWEKYTLYKSSQVAASTLVKDYGKIAKRLREMRVTLKNAIEVRDWLLSEFSSEVARRTLGQLNACFKWAVKSGLTLENPVVGLTGRRKELGCSHDMSHSPQPSLIILLLIAI